MAINRQFTLFSLQSLAYAKLRSLVINGIKKNGAIPDDVFAISADATENQQTAASDIFQNVLLDVLLHAVVDDDRKSVQTILDAYPELLLINPPTNLVIESKLTWQKFYGEEALKMAVKRKQIKMIELLLPYYDKLEQTEDVIKAKREALSAWETYEIQKNPNTYDEIIIPKEYADYAESLIDVFIDETFPNGVPSVKDVPSMKDVPFNVVLSDKTELALSALLNILVPKTAVKLDEHIDEELLLWAIFKAYEKNFLAFNYNWGKLDTLCVRLIGLTQSALIPETGEIWCESLDDVVTAINEGKEKEISPEAASHHLKNGEDFYRGARGSRSGLGFNFLCGPCGIRRDVATARANLLSFGKTMLSKYNKFWNVESSNCCDIQTTPRQMTSGPAV